MKKKSQFQSYKNAKKIALTLVLKGKEDWVKWAKSNSRPKSIPADPVKVYSKNWKGWGDWLGTGNIASKNRNFITYNEAKKYVQALNIKSQNEWRSWSKTKLRPVNIPANPERTYTKNWRGWKDFLGTTNQSKFRSFETAKELAVSLHLNCRKEWYTWAKTSNRPIDIPVNPCAVYKNKWKGWTDFLGSAKKYCSFEETKNYVQNLKLKSQNEWFQWTKINHRPSNIPKYPHLVYAKHGWCGFGDFLGTGNVHKNNFLPFDKARNFAHSLKLKSKNDWTQWAKTTNKPHNIPASPSVAYKKQGWLGWGDFLGTHYIAPQNKKFRSFATAKSFAQTLGLRSETEWNKWAKTSQRPIDVPSSPRKTYRNKGWKGFGDFLGTGFIANQHREYRSFEESKLFARSLRLKTGDEWMSWAKTKNKPTDIPTNPAGVYENQWQGWADWLGFTGKWSIHNIRLFVKSLLPILDKLSPAGLYLLFQQSGLLNIGHNTAGKSFVQALKTGRFPREEIEKFANNKASLVDEFLADPSLSLEDENLLASQNCLSEMEVSSLNDELPTIETQDILATLDNKILSSSDEETIDFFKKEAVANIWKHAFLNETEAICQFDEYKEAGTLAEEAKKLFMTEYDGTKKLVIPAGYNFPAPPNLMQCYTAYLLKTRKRIGNWSGTGAGKTLSAILASKVINAKLTIICCPNNVIDNWKRNIEQIYPGSSIKIKDTKIRPEEKIPDYIILNYEFFQQPWAEKKLKALINQYCPDFVIIDEIHFSKQREAENMSERKKIISSFLFEVSEKNDNLHVLGMSATPVINNLFEGKTMIELITGVCHDDLQTKPTVPNCISLYKQFVSHGIRWIPEYHYKLNRNFEEIDCSHYVPEIKRINNIGSVVDMEAILTKAKIPFILKNLKSKTIIYTHYLKGILNVLQEAIETAGWKVAIFTGENKSGLDEFIDGNADILIASCCIGAGVDRLQHVCNRLIVNCLPWTHAEFEQLKGRLYRQGQKQDQIDIYIPITFSTINGVRWSWCESRWKRIEYKKSIADAAVDGTIPEGHLRTPAQAYKDVMLWLERLERGEIYEIEREKISIPLSDEIKQTIRKKYGDLSQMNHRINHELSKETHLRFLNDPSEWEHYHAVYREDRKRWPIIPYEEAIKWFKPRPHMVIGDFGCGEAFLSSQLENQVFSFDHVAINKDVVACDLSLIPLDDTCLDAAVFSLSLMGTNFFDYLKEAHRCLKLDGYLWIAEPTSRINDINLFRDLLFRLGFDVARVDKKWKFTFIKAIKTEREINNQIVNSIKPKDVLN